MKVIIKPWITEKATQQSEERNIFSFIVDKRANKIEIAKAIQELYGVSVVKVHTMVYGGGKDAVKYTNRGVAIQANNPWKKALITVAEGETINFFDNI